MSKSSLEALGFSDFFRQQIGDDPGRPARIIEVQRSGLRVLGEDIDAWIEPAALKHVAAVTVGDWLLVDSAGNRALRLLRRKSLFKRRAAGIESREQLIAANVDTAFIVSSCNSDFNEARSERYLAMAREADVNTLIVLTKADLAGDPREFINRASRIVAGTFAEAVDARDADSLQGLSAWLQTGETVALLGSSGVGKSTLTNTLLGSSAIATADVRSGDDKGRHTTTTRSMHRIPDGAWLIDMPGMRELRLTDVREGIDDVFAELSNLAACCRFADCEHLDEPGCAIQAAIRDGDIPAERLQRWQKLRREDARNRQSIAERRARDKALGKYYKDVLGSARHAKGRTGKS